MFSDMMMPMSATSPIAMARPARDMMLLPTPKRFIRMNVSATASGSVETTVAAVRRCSRKKMTTALASSTSSPSASVSVARVSRTMSERS